MSFMLNLSFPNITENNNIIVQKYCSENRSTAFHTSKGFSYITSKENWNHLFLHIQEEYFYFSHSKRKKVLSGLEQAVELFSSNLCVNTHVKKHLRVTKHYNTHGLHCTFFLKKNQFYMQNVATLFIIYLKHNFM